MIRIKVRKPDKSIPESLKFYPTNSYYRWLMYLIDLFETLIKWTNLSGFDTDSLSDQEIENILGRVSSD